LYLTNNINYPTNDSLNQAIDLETNDAKDKSLIELNDQSYDPNLKERVAQFQFNLKNYKNQKELFDKNE